MESEKSPVPIADTYHSQIEKILKGNVVVVRKTAHRKTDRTRKQWQTEVQVMKVVVEQAGFLGENMSKLMDSDVDDLSLTMRYEGGKSLDLYVTEKMLCTIEPEDAQILWHQMSKAIVFLHNHSIIHDDVKPDNMIWIPEEHRAVLIDFGAAIIVTPEEGIPFSPSGTPPYAPPEFLVRRKEFAGDIWGLGITILFAKKRIPLPEGDWILPHCFVEEEPRNKMQAWLASIEEWRLRMEDEDVVLGRMLDANPDKRITAKDLVTELRHRENAPA